jgi:hypothetical protein
MIEPSMLKSICLYGSPVDGSNENCIAYALVAAKRNRIIGVDAMRVHMYKRSSIVHNAYHKIRIL